MAKKQHRLTIQLGTGDRGAELKKRINDRAKSEGRSRGNLVRTAVEIYLDEPVRQ